MNTFSLNAISTLFVLILQAFPPCCPASPLYLHSVGSDTLFVLKPLVLVSSNNNNTIVSDALLLEATQDLIDSVSRDLLKKKFTIDTARLFVNNAEAMAELLESLDEKGGLAEAYDVDQFLPVTLQHRGGYALVLQYNGQYHPDFPPHFKLQSAMMGVAIVTPGNPTKAVSEMRLLVVELKTGKAVLFDRAKSSKYDARLDDDLIQMTRTFLKKVYYRKW